MEKDEGGNSKPTFEEPKEAPSENGDFEPVARWAVDEYNKEKNTQLVFDKVIWWRERILPTPTIPWVITYFIILQTKDPAKLYQAVVGDDPAKLSLFEPLFNQYWPGC